MHRAGRLLASGSDCTAATAAKPFASCLPLLTPANATSSRVYAYQHLMPVNGTKCLSKACGCIAGSSEMFSCHLHGSTCMHGRADFAREKPEPIASEEPTPLAQPVAPSLALRAPPAQTPGSAEGKRMHLPFLVTATLT